MQRLKTYAVYIMANRSRGIYTGFASDLFIRVWQHRTTQLPGFTRRYEMTKLVYYELTNDVRSAIAREKEIKRWTRAKKIALIESVNPEWKDLAADWFSEGGPETADGEEPSIATEIPQAPASRAPGAGRPPSE